MDFRGKRVTLIGLGARTHVALARYLVRKGAEVTISDIKTADQLRWELGLLGDLPIRLSLGRHRLEDTINAHIVFVTPGARRDLPCLLAAQERGIPISSEIELFFLLCPAPIVGITGSSGKTTTTSLTGEIFTAGGRRVFVGGNIGTPLIERVEEMDEDCWVVLELSSFQLEHLRISPHIGALLNIVPNHLDRHPTMEDYIAAKKSIYKYQESKDFAVFSHDNPITRKLASKAPGQTIFFSRTVELDRGAYIKGGEIVYRYDGSEQVIGPVSDIKLRGLHNLENALAATAIARAAGVPSQAIAEAIRSFRGVEHRLEWVATVDRVNFYNDSIATSPDRTLAALSSFDEPILLIAGGRDKHLPLEELAEAITSRVKGLVLYGEAASLLRKAVERADPAYKSHIYQCRGLAEAIDEAHLKAGPGDIVLLSPAFPSFDQFRDFEERGQVFKELVMKLRRPALR